MTMCVTDMSTLSAFVALFLVEQFILICEFFVLQFVILSFFASEPRVAVFANKVAHITGLLDIGTGFFNLNCRGDVGF